MQTKQSQLNTSGDLCLKRCAINIVYGYVWGGGSNKLEHPRVYVKDDRSVEVRFQGRNLDPKGGGEYLHGVAIVLPSGQIEGGHPMYRSVNER